MSRAAYKTSAQWEAIVTEFRSGTESECDFCSRRDIKLVTLRKWRYHFRDQAKLGVSPGATGFVKVHLTEQPATPSHNAAVLCIGPDVRLECPSSFDVAALAQLALAVHHGR